MRNPSKYQSSPLCPRCGVPMRMSRLAPYYCGTLTQTFECDLCDAAVTDQSATAVKALAAEPAAA